MLIPPAFRARRTLEGLNIAGVGLSLAAATAVVFSLMFDGVSVAAFSTGIPTLFFGALWARLLRWPKTLGPSWLRVGWLMSIPFAALNAAMACGLMFTQSTHASEGLMQFLTGCALGATVGVIVWGPALVLTLLAFGAPIAWSQRLALRGLAGQERGEAVVGGASTLVALAAMVLTLVGAQRTHQPMGVASVVFLGVLGLLGALSGSAALGLSWLRGRQRERFVAKVEAGEVEHFRVDTTEEGRVLIRVISQGTNYRVADYEEEVAALDREGIGRPRWAARDPGT